MLKFPSIDSIHHVFKHVHKHNNWCLGNNQPEKFIRTVDYIGSVKLHGTNGSIAVNTETGEVEAFSRERPLTVESDNYGFAFWVAANSQAILEFAKKYFNNGVVRFYGEWIGKGIQKGVAVSELEKHFVCFMIHFDGKFFFPGAYDNSPFRWVAEAPIFGITLDFSENADNTDVLNDIEKLTNMVETECPWGKLHGVVGTGEGIVWMPVINTLAQDTSLWFKTKGLKHKKPNKEGKKITVDPTIVEGINNLVDNILPEWRLEQGISYLKENGMEVNSKFTGEYIKWIHKDILKECTEEIAANGYEWKQVNSYVSTKARAYFIKAVQDAALNG
jgi:hypothetical protein